MYTSLHNHTNYSFLDGLNRIDDMILRAKELGQKSLAITDHGSMSGVPKFYKKCKAYGIKPILGMEAYFTPDPTLKGKKGEHSSHLLLLAKNEAGYKNLMRLSTASYLDHFYYDPRVTIELLDKHREGLIVSTACLASPFRRAWLPKQTDLEGTNIWVDRIEEIIEIFKDDIYFEVQPYESDLQTEYNRVVREKAEQYGRPCIVSTDAHYTTRQDFDHHDSLLTMQMGRMKGDDFPMKHECNSLYIHSESELLRKGYTQDEIDNTTHIADQCNVELDFSVKFPIQENALERIKAECNFQLENRQLGKEYQDRVEHELDVIEKCGFADYFILIQNIRKTAIQKKIPCGSARGSVGGSLVCNLLGITDVDPIKHELLFERFINEDRVGLPDIDLDFSKRHRPEVIEYIIEEFGRDKTANICTFNKMGIRQAFKDLCKIYRISFEDSNYITKHLPDGARNMKEAYEEKPELEEMIRERNIPKELLDQMNTFIGMPRQAGTHAAAMVISPDDIENHVPLRTVGKANDKSVATQYDMYDIEDIGLVKFDILGVNALTVIDDTILSLDRDRDEVYREMHKINDPKVYEMIASGHTLGCFQIETPAISELCRRLQISSFEDLAHVISLNRPGVTDSGMLEEYFYNREHPRAIRYVHPAIKHILKDTYGILLFQEQIMQASMILAGFSASQADRLRSGIGKKKMDVIESLRDLFLQGCLKNGHSKESALKVFDVFEKSGRYLFNKSHAVGYAYTSYYTAWLKCHYPAEFTVALLNSNKKPEMVDKYIKDARRIGINVRSFHINESDYLSKIKDGDIIAGIGLIKGAGIPAGEALEKERKNGEFKSFEDFMSRYNQSKINTKVLLSLVKLDAFNGLGYTREELTENTEEILDCAKRVKKARAKKMKDSPTLFDMSNFTDIAFHPKKTHVQYSAASIRQIEKELLDFYLSDPFIGHEEYINSYCCKNWDEIEEAKVHGNIRVVGVVDFIRIFTYKDKRSNRSVNGAHFDLIAPDERLRFSIFSPLFEYNRDLIMPGMMVEIECKYNLWKGNRSLIVQNIGLFE